MSLSRSQYTSNSKDTTRIPASAVVADRNVYDTSSASTSLHPDHICEKQKLISIFDTETMSSENKSFEVLRQSDLMDDTMKTEDLNVTTASKETVTEHRSEARYVKRKPKIQHNLHRNKIKSRKGMEKGQSQTRLNLQRSQSQLIVNQNSPILQKKLQHQLGQLTNDSSLSSEWSSSSSLDGGRLGNYVEAKIRGRSKRKYRVQGYPLKRSRSQGHLAVRSYSQSMLRSPQSRDRSLDGIIRPEKNFILERWWATLGDIPAAIDGIQNKECGDIQHRTIKKHRKKKRFQNGKIKILILIYTTK